MFYFTTKDIDYDELHDVDQELNALVEFDHEIEKDGNIID